MKLAPVIITSILMVSSVVAETTNIESKGNLESETKIELKEVFEITNKNNPVDIFELVGLKVNQEKYDEAAIAFLIGGAYGYFDIARVEDKSAHQAITVLQMNLGSSLSEEKSEALQAALRKALENSEKVIDALNKVGKPDYHPSYMIQHGMGAFTGNKSKDGLIADFDSDKAWKEILDGLKQ